MFYTLYSIDKRKVRVYVDHQFIMYRLLSIPKSIIIFVVIFPILQTVTSFASPRFRPCQYPYTTLTINTAAADEITTNSAKSIQLTDRQLQFWEDVEDGLDDIESFWAKKGQNIERIRLFGQR
jgi:hypothetical protein